MILDRDVREKAIEGDYEPECTNWVKTNGKDLIIRWRGYSNTLYNRARSLPGSKWNNGAVVVRVEHYKEVQEFAELYGFKFSSGALEAIEAHKKAQAKIETVTPAKVEEPEQKDGLKEILNSGSDIIDDLKD